LKKHIFLILSFIIFISTLGVCESLASEDTPKSWDIHSYEAMIHVNTDGSVSVEEYVTYKFNKNYTGVVRKNIDAFAASAVENISIHHVSEVNEEDIKKSKLEQIKSDAYEVLYDQEYGFINGIDISVDAEEKQKTLVYKYTLYDLVGIYKDMALLEWSFINKEDGPCLGDISISVHIPKGGDVELTQAFLQGVLYSQQLQDNSVVQFDASLMTGEDDLRLLLLLPTSMVAEGRKIIDNEITEQVLADMQQYEEMIGQARQAYERRQLTVKLLTILSCVFIVGVLAFLFVKYDKDPKTGIKKTYVNELPANYYTPAELGVFMNKGRIREDYIIATLIDLVNRGYIKAESQEEEGFVLSQNPETDTKDLKAHEQYLLIWLFDDFGHGSTNISTKDFETWIKDSSNSQRYQYKYNTWKKLVLDQADKWKFFENVKRAKLYGLLIGVVAIIPGVVLYTMGEAVKGLVVVGLSLILMAYSQFIRKRTNFGAINNVLWRSFKNYLENPLQSDLPKPKLDVWDRFLAYSIPIKGANYIIEQIAKLYGSDNLTTESLFFLHRDNMDKTKAWLDSMKSDDVFGGKFLGAFSLPQLKKITIDKKG
jgi:hypothetical protein